MLIVKNVQEVIHLAVELLMFVTYAMNPASLVMEIITRINLPKLVLLAKTSTLTQTTA